MDDSDCAQAVMERATERALCDRLTRKCRVEDTPGRRVCADCGGDIPAARLVAVPDAIRCVNCQSIMEAGHVDQHR
ncbi:TraR/DksA family transcriptional regulator [Escherichia coli]|uniref:TraR/DksA family transcriptional regulator n=1 Tax=Enterobacteriaceae TaxID=543 RepID=UPI0002674866|nr:MULTISPECIES: TraR/DksA family transcriptional regulator [Enterobacteriaceae]EIQ40768.1 phage/conjugal plasmid C-4 type zinc finger, TraR family protein [Shigella sonnei 3226-85]EAA1954230.1 TraR/DksA family transcriptional regulator [Escherichia coli]EAA4756849.1 TraR/DksA family transcriptional regulator [Shigella sonnei]EAB6839003.1 TraR/DksA family transcriptional regulator [Escherichia coli]EER8056805.1 TraR/DksA family transcriptional regulator [Escherichia coli]